MSNTKPIGSAHFKTFATDFVVTEIMDTALHDGKGEHLWLSIQKTGVNTAHVAKLLSQWANIAPSCVHYSGRKDRHALTTQWFSLHIPSPKKQQTLNPHQFERFAERHLKPNESIRVLAHHYHTKKLHKGAHRYNDFVITLRQVRYHDAADLNHHLAQIGTRGMPNFFGQQRFGKNNLAKFVKFAKTHHNKRKINQTEALLISAGRSHIFNEILHKRVMAGTWDKPICGDVFMLAGTSSVFCADVDDDIRRRVAMGDIHPTGLLYSAPTNIHTSDEALAIERAVIDDCHNLCQALTALNIQAARRSLRATVHNISHHIAGDVLSLQFRLETGAFATSLLSALVDDLVDVSSTMNDVC